MSKEKKTKTKIKTKKYKRKQKRERKKKSDGLDKSRVSAHGHLCHLIIKLVGPERKHPSPTKFFPSPPSIQTLTKNIFLPIFFSEVFHSPYFTSKQTHPKIGLKNIFKNFL